MKHSIIVLAVGSKPNISLTSFSNAFANFFLDSFSLTSTESLAVASVSYNNVISNIFNTVVSLILLYLAPTWLIILSLISLTLLGSPMASFVSWSSVFNLPYVISVYFLPPSLFELLSILVKWASTNGVGGFNSLYSLMNFLTFSIYKLVNPFFCLSVYSKAYV